MKDDVDVMVGLAAERGKVEILAYLLSSYSDIIDINKQDKVINDILSSFRRRYNMSVIGWRNSFNSSCSAWVDRLCEIITCLSKHKSYRFR